MHRISLIFLVLVYPSSFIVLSCVLMLEELKKCSDCVHQQCWVAMPFDVEVCRKHLKLQEKRPQWGCTREAKPCSAPGVCLFARGLHANSIHRLGRSFLRFLQCPLGCSKTGSLQLMGRAPLPQMLVTRYGMQLGWQQHSFTACHLYVDVKEWSQPQPPAFFQCLPQWC